ncbi:hypothetical protein ElyMa_003437600 [Elysia marginata]|uniref:Ig-like domain-containing protein n=1 Tax=Elysia marginata TaxID=1093978 RepID=A0AAV4JXJ4_9GAST|nr:hypothetical protein ElyMa_003437600 [Elysia marginata]
MNPGAPVITVKYPPESNYVYPNQMLEAGCLTLTDKGGKVKFRLQHSVSNFTDFDGLKANNSATFTLEENGVYVEVDRRCFPRSKARLTLLVATSPVAVSPRSPVLTLDNSGELALGTDLMASCDACVGSGGKLAWTLTTRHSQLKWIVDPDNPSHTIESSGQTKEPTTQTQDVKNTTITWKFESDHDCGPRIKSRFQLKVQHEMEDSVLTCGILNPRWNQHESKENHVKSAVIKVGVTTILAVVVVVSLVVTITGLAVAASQSKLYRKMRKSKSKKGEKYQILVFSGLLFLFFLLF